MGETKTNVTVKTHIAEAVEVTDLNAKYDAEAKKILSDKNILAWILKRSAEEFKDLTIEEIINCIEGEPEVGNVPVYPGRKPGKITGMNTEDAVPGEGVVTYDIRFSAFVPGGTGKERIKLIINVEAQKKYHPGYDLVTRCIFYMARQLSAQLDTEFTGDNYDDIKKVYSIWICMDVPRYAENTITKYDIKQTPLVGEFKGHARYDLMAGIMICLGKEIKKEKGSLLYLLGALLSDELKPEEKEKLLEADFGIETAVPAKEGLRTMCNLSELIEEKGIEKGIEKGMEKGMEKGQIRVMRQMLESGMPVEKIADIVKIPVEEVKKMVEK